MSSRDLIAHARATTTSVALDELRRRLDAHEDVIVVDVREPEEVAEGTLPGAIAIPRGLLELRIEERVPDRASRLVTMCAGGTRSALAAKTLLELGYLNVETADPGFSSWKELGYPVVVPPQLTTAQRSRYARHLLLPEVGEAGQARLLGGRVLVVGAGGLGSPAALYLAAAGVGHLGLVDDDVVDASNLQRQVLHATSRIGVPKVDSAEVALRDLNPDVRVTKFRDRLSAANVERIFEGWDVVVDGTDNFATRYLVNDASVWLGKPVVHGSIFRFDGQVSTFVSAKAAEPLGIAAGPCYRCLYPEPPPPHLAPSCQEAGVLGVLPGVVGLLQATEALKLLLGIGTPLVGRLLAYDSLRMTFRELKLPPSEACPVCGPSPTIRTFVDYAAFCSR